MGRSPVSQPPSMAQFAPAHLGTLLSLVHPGQHGCTQERPLAHDMTSAALGDCLGEHSLALPSCQRAMKQCGQEWVVLSQHPGSDLITSTDTAEAALWRSPWALYSGNGCFRLVKLMVSVGKMARAPGNGVDYGSSKPLPRQGKCDHGIIVYCCPSPSWPKAVKQQLPSCAAGHCATQVLVILEICQLYHVLVKTSTLCVPVP